ncbi:MAG: hypothetical protein KAS86_05660, partial [Candidatus Omnitrophica bacterium]|nr:hypothetical protein [Candidatus Omnitrophota bacterium]
MAYVLGIDEAGLSPVVGPLVVSGSLFRTAEQDEGANFWRLLEGCVSNRPKNAAGRLVVADSKKLHKKGDFSRLEEGIFSFLYCRGARRVQNLALLLGQLNARVEHKQYPWYEPGKLKLPAKTWRNTARRHGNRLKDGMKKVGMTFSAFFCEPVLGDEFNRGIARTHNKSMLLWERVSRIIYATLKVCSGENLTVCVDKLGGRGRYDDLL